MIQKLSDRVTLLFTRISAVLLVAVVLLTVVNVILRVVFNAPIKGAIEYIQYGVMLVAALMLSRTSFEDKHIYITVFTEKFPLRIRSALYSAGRIISAAFFGILAYYYFSCIPDAASTLRTTDVLKIPYQYIYIIMGLGFTLGTLMFLLQGCRYASAVFRKAGPPTGTDSEDKVPHEDDPV